ncbi:MAG: hypothetical protein ACKVQJ_05110 [Pyrinomonadaceae bacterium]
MLSLFTIHFSLFTAASAQSRDFLTDEEVELIRDAQQIDLRIDVLTHAIDRRFEVLKVDVKAPPLPKKGAELWGKLPEGTRLQLLNDIRRILQKAIDDIDNLAERPESMVVDPDAEKDKKKQKGYAELFPKAVRSLASAVARYQPALKMEIDKTTDNMEKGVILASLEMCDEIAAAAAKLPAEVLRQKH